MTPAASPAAPPAGAPRAGAPRAGPPRTARAFTTRGDGIDALRWQERPLPRIGATDVLVTMRAAALNYRDLLVVNGVHGWKPPEPRVPGSDAVGVVAAAGRAVTRVRVGDRVAGIFLPRWLGGELTSAAYVGPLGGATADGVLAEHRAFDEQAVVRVPDHLSDAEAATLPVAAVTAWHALRRSGVRAGESVLIEGTGGVSLFALQFAHALGARPLVISSSDAKLARATALGASWAVNYTRTPAWEREVLALTGGAGVDHVVEVVGGAHLNRALEAVRVSGTVSFVGLLGGLGAPVDTYRFVTKNVRLHGIETGSRAMFEEMNAFIAARGLRPVLDRTFPVAELPDALRHLERGAHVGKVALAF
jgi:NADPH:quinone reductase-like Zn-dependent oxidoreductase